MSTPLSPLHFLFSFAYLVLLLFTSSNYCEFMASILYFVLYIFYHFLSITSKILETHWSLFQNMFIVICIKRYRERLQTTYIKNRKPSDTDKNLVGKDWLFLKDGLDDFRDGLPPPVEGDITLKVCISKGFIHKNWSKNLFRFINFFFTFPLFSYIHVA